MSVFDIINIPRRHFLRDLVSFFAATFASNIFLSCSNGKNNRSNVRRLMHPQFQDITIMGDLLLRAQKNYDRLHDPIYQYENIANHTMNDPYPGDFIGRTILGLVQLAQVLGKEPLYLEEIIKRFQKELINKKGYLGKVLEKGFYDENHITGHQFFLRGLCEYYMWKRDNSIHRIIETTVNNMMIPLAEEIKSYPLGEKRKKLKKGNEIAMDAGSVDNWQLSTDTCQIFMVLDGLTQVYQLFPSIELKKAIEKTFDFYSKINLLEIKAQIHSNLSALRGILRYYETDGDNKYLDFVKETFESYKKHAWTENYENYNWFGRPTHTEGCAVIDSFLLATELWKVTGQTHYLRDAHLIYYNGVMNNQWINGGFGVNSCVGPDKNLFLKHRVEATWCCTMRGGEGLAKAIQYSYFYDQNNIYIPFYHDNRVTLRFKEGDLILEMSSVYPFEGRIQLLVVNSNIKTSKQFHFFMPEWIDIHSLKVFHDGNEIKHSINNSFISFFSEPRNNDRFSITFDIKFYKSVPQHKETLSQYYRYYHGPLLLGCASDEEIKLNKNQEFRQTKGQCTFQSEDGIRLKPSNTFEYKDMDDQKKMSFQFLFRDD